MNRAISKGLILGLLLNSTSISSFANIDIPNRYQTLEGEYITIDDSSEGHLEEIEIFGNTIQNENDLEDIQSVGDLYVDDNGNPILDKQGREQYKIEINSYDYKTQNQLGNPDITSSPFPGTTVDGEWNKFKWDIGDYKVSSKGAYSRETLETSNEDKIYVRFDIVKLSDAYYNSTIFSSRGGGHRFNYMTGDEYNSLEVGKEYTHSTLVSYYGPDNYSDLNIEFGVHSREIECEFKIKEPILVNLTRLYGKGNEPSKEWCDNNISYVSDNKVYYNQNSINTILLPVQLQKIGSLTDKLYWDNENGRYVIEKKIYKWVITATENSWRKHIDYTPGEGFSGFNFTTNQVFPEELLPKDFGLRLGNNGFGSSAGHTSRKRGTDFHFNGNGKLLIEEDIIPDDNLELLKEWLKDNYSYIYYELKKPLHIETNITSKLKIPTYDDKTHIFIDSENGINPTLRVTVDRLPQVAKEAIKEAELNSTIDNISLARIYINMLPESLYKDLLQEQLNEVFTSDIALDTKSATSNMDVYIKSSNTLSMSLNTNSITFEEFSGIEDLEKQGAIEIIISSSLPYSLNAYLPIEIQNSDKSNTMKKEIINIKENKESD